MTLFDPQSQGLSGNIIDLVHLDYFKLSIWGVKEEIPLHGEDNGVIDLRSAQVYCVAIFLTCWHPSHFTISFLL